MNVYDAIDFKYSWRGDYIPGTDGDFADTNDDQIQSVIQEIQTIANSSLGDWEENPQYAASLDDYIGEPNNRDTSNAIIERLRTAILTNNIVRSEDLLIKIMPIDRHKILILVSIDAASTPNNSIIRGSNPVIAIVYDWFERGILFI